MQRLRDRTPDRLLAALATMSLLLLVRNGGNVLATSKRRLQIQPGNATRILLNPNLTKPKVTEQLLQAGAVGWWLSKTQASNQENSFPSAQSKLGLPIEQSNGEAYESDFETSVLPEIDFHEIKKQPFLIHWTRRRVWGLAGSNARRIPRRLDLPQCTSSS